MLNGPPMSSCAKLLFSALVAAGLAAPSVAFAQTTSSGGTTSGATVSPSGQAYPIRLNPNGSDVCGDSQPQPSCVSTRPANLTPFGINYQDCISNQVLQFSVTLSGFDGGEILQVWASATSDCAENPTDRGIGSSAALCWKVAGDLPGVIVTTPQTYVFNIPVTTIVGWQEKPPFPPPSSPQLLPTSTACYAQATFAAVQMNVNFVPVDSSGNYAGTAFQYQINTDLVGPPAPTGVAETVGDTIFNLSWTANSDSDTAGYDVFIDPIPGQEGAEAAVPEAASTTKLVCPDASSTTLLDATSEVAADAIADASTVEASTSEEASTPEDAACYYINVGGAAPTSSNGYSCNDPILASSTTEDGGLVDGAIATTPVVLEDGGEAVESGSVEEGSGGISTIPLAYAVGGANNNANAFTVTDKAVGNYTIKGLTDGVTYNVVVAAVDGSGNIGPSSLEVCDYPAPIQDFWQTYNQDGGFAGGFCALETVGAGGTSLAGVGFVVAGAALMRRRRRSGR